MLTFVLTTLIVALLASWIILFISKIGLREWVQVHAPLLISQLFSCDFCLSWWTSLAVAVCFGIAAGDIIIFLTAFAATPLTRHLIS